jgi:hypothetical protein
MSYQLYSSDINILPFISKNRIAQMDDDRGAEAA